MKIALVHGRFQPPHNGHIRYILSALDKADHVLIGICTPEICSKEESERTGYPCTKELNPFTYEARAEMISLALSEVEIDISRYSFLEFPSDYKNINNIVPKDTVFFMSKTSKSDDEKIEAIKLAGFQTDILIEIPENAPRERSGHVRNMDNDWENMVPKVIEKYLKSKNS